MPRPIALSAALILLAAALLVMLPAIVTAQDEAAQKSAEDMPPEGDAKEAERLAEEKRKAIEEYQDAAENLPVRAGAPECVWTGRRIASLLWRDDLATAERYMALYDQFDCSPEHLTLAFRCVIKRGPIDPKAAEELATRVHNCWVLPEEPRKEASRVRQKNGTRLR